jgi:hypothetical protein
MRAREVVIALAFAAGTGGAATAVVSGCGGGGGNAGGSGPCPTLDSCPDAAPSWSTQVEPIVATYCSTSQCHGDGAAQQMPYDYTSYAVVHARYVPMLTQVSMCSMPPSDTATPLPPDLRQTLLCWLEAEAPDN